MTSHASRFQSTVPFYGRYRLAYPARLIERVIALTGLVLSTCSPEKLGPRIGAFEAELRAALAGSGDLSEIATLAALIARRP